MVIESTTPAGSPTFTRGVTRGVIVYSRSPRVAPWLAAGLGLWAVARVAVAQENDPGAEAFKHYLHVSPEWLKKENQERKRDCRGCHDYENDRDPSVDLCRRCHYNEEQRRIYTAEGFGGFAALRDATSAFRHRFHFSLDCRSCHHPAGGIGREPTGGYNDQNVPADMPIPLGAGVCMRCHDPKSDARPPAARVPGLLARHVAGLNRRAPKRPERFAGFRHGDHLSKADLTNPAACIEPCHAGVPGSNAQTLGDRSFSVDSCGECHRTADGVVRIDPAKRPRESRSAACFTHEPHLSAEARAADENIESQLCLACHEQNENDGTYDLKPDFGTYDSCVQCHAHQSWKIADHGEVDDCRGCHTVGEGDMKTNRPRVEVERPRPLAFRIESQSHPFITKNGANREVADDCARCHVAQLAVLPSRLGRRDRFSHKTHLPAKPAAGDCEPCHAAIARTKGPQEIRVTFSTTVCKDCHVVAGEPGGAEEIAEIEAVFPEKEKIVRREVISFPHEPHVGARGAAGETYTCLSCHEPDTTDAANDVGTKAEALDCSKCHDHDENFRVTANRDRQYVESCTRCHASGVPAKGEKVVVERLAVTGLLDVQHHPDDTSCAKCHQVAVEELIKVAREHDDHFFGEELTSENYHFIRNDGPNARPKWTDCLCCHWGQQHQRNRRPDHFTRRYPSFFRPLIGDDVGSYPGKGCRTQ